MCTAMKIVFMGLACLKSFTQVQIQREEFRPLQADATACDLACASFNWFRSTRVLKNELRGNYRKQKIALNAAYFNLKP